VSLAGARELTARDVTDEGGQSSRGVVADGVRILMVDDHPDTLRGLSMLLERRGCKVFSASTLAEAIEIAGRETFDVLLSDIGLPDGTGLDLVKLLKPSRCAYAIALSGYGMDSDIAKSKAAGFDEHLTKPVDVARLGALLEAWKENRK